MYLVLFVLICLSAYFSLTETAFTALNKVRIKNMAGKGNKKARLVLEIHNNFDRMLSTLLVGTTVANLASAAICAVLFVYRFGDIGATLSTVVLTIVVVIFAEITPKTLAKESPEKIAMFCALPMQFFMSALTPVNAFFAWWKRVLVRLAKPNIGDQAMTEDELLSIVDEAKHTGVIDEDDTQLIHNIIEFYDQKAEDIFTPRMDMVSVSKNAATNEIAARFLETGFSRVPVYDTSIDNIVGTLHVRHFLGHVMRQDASVESIISPPVFVSGKMDIGDLFKRLQQEKCHMAIVVDEYGGTDGIVTMEDILEELLGEIWDESDKAVEAFVAIGEHTHRVMCVVDTHEFFDYFGLDESDLDKLPATVNRWVIDTLSKIPEKGDAFKYKNLTVTVSKVEGKRALEVVVNKIFCGGDCRKPAK